MKKKEAWTLRQKITGVLLRQARTEAGKSLEECGEILGLSSSTLSAVEHGRRPISLPELEVLAYYLGVSLERLLNGSSEPIASRIEDLPTDRLLALRHRIIGALLRRARLELDLTQAEIAERIKIPEGRLSQYELGETPIPLVELEAMAEVIDVPLGYFLDEGIGPIGEQQQLQRQWQKFVELPLDVRIFASEPSNLDYLRLAMSLSAVSAEKLRNIAASLLEITL